MSDNAAAVLADLAKRYDALEADLQARLSRDAMIQFFQTFLTENPEAVRKFVFAGQASPSELVGSKYARYGLSVADVEWLYDVQMSLRGQRKTDGSAYTGPSDALTRTYRHISDSMYLSEDEVKAIDKRALDGLFPRIPKSAFTAADRNLLKRGASWQDTELYARHARAMDTAESGFGSQLVGAQYVGDLWDAARRDSVLFGLIDTFEMTDPVAYLPVEVDFPEMLFVGESTANNSSNFSTSKTGSQRVAVTAYKFVIHQMWSGEMEEDSIIPFIPFLRRQAQLALGHYSDSAILNGDTTNAATGNINLDDADPADTKHYLAFDGIRHAGLIDNTANSSDHGNVAITLAALNAQRARMVDSTRFVDWGHPTDPNDLIYVSDVTSADNVALLDEFVTLDKAGPTAGIFNGQRGRVFGHPFLASMAMSRTEADGRVSTTGGNNTRGQITAFNRRGFKAGWRRRVRLETERLPASDQTRLVYSLRMGFARFSPTGAASGIEATDTIYNIA